MCYSLRRLSVTLCRILLLLRPSTHHRSGLGCSTFGIVKLTWKEMETDHLVSLPCDINEEKISQRNQMYSLGENGEAMASSPCGSILRLSNACPQEDGNLLASENADKNKKKVSRIVGWGLRRFSKIVCQKVQAKGRTTYNEVADEIIADLATLNKSSEFEFDEKNIRRRVYDAFNVLLAINVIAKNKKEIHWIGFPNTSTKALEDLKRRHMNVTNRINEKANYLRELEAKAFDIRKLIVRNQHMHCSGNVSSEGVALPFLLVQVWFLSSEAMWHACCH